MATTKILGKEINALSASFASTAQTVVSASYATTATTASTAASASTQRIGTNAQHYPVFVVGSNTNPATEILFTSNNYNFNPSTRILEITGSLFATSITGSLSGSATTATSASTALNTTNTNHFITFVPDNNSGGPAAEAFGTVGNLTYNPSIGSLNATSITGSLRGTASYAAVASQSGYTIQMVLATTGSNLAASTTYRMGAPVRNQLLTTGGTNRIYVPRPGKVRYVNVFVRTNGTLASAGTSTFQLNRQNVTFEVIGTSTSVGSVASVSVESTAMSMSVALGEYLDIGFTTPAWATLPTAVEASAIIYIENNI